MLQKTHLALLFVSLVSFVYIARDTRLSPGTLFRKSMARMLDDQQLTNALCQDLEINVTITASEKATAMGHIPTYANLSSGNPLINFIESPGAGNLIVDDYIKPLATKAAFFAVFIILSVGSFIYYLTVWCCVTFGMCRKFTICKGPKATEEHKLHFAIATGVLMLGMFITGIIGAANSTAIKHGGNQIVCSMAVLAEKTLEGSDSEDWAGVQQIMGNVQVLMSAWPAVVPQLTSLYQTASVTDRTIEAGVVTNLNIGINATKQYYTSNSDLVVEPRPNPLSGQASYTPTYVLNLSNWTNAIENEMTSKNTTIFTAAATADQGLSQFTSQFIVDGYLLLSSANESISNISNALTSYGDNITTLGQHANNRIYDLGAGLTALFVINILLAFGAILAIIAGAHYAMKHAHHFMNFTWCLMSILVLIGWILGLTLYPATMLVFQGCDAGAQLLNNATFFNLTMDKFIVNNFTTGQPTDSGPTTKDFLYNCYHGDGNSNEGLDIADMLGQFTTIFTALQQAAPLTRSQGTVPTSIEIPEQLSLLAQYQQGLLSDSNITSTDLATLNGLANQATDSCTNMQDTWVLNSSLCTPNLGTVFKASSSASFNVYSPTCIGFDAWGSNAASARYNSTTFPINLCTGPSNSYSNMQEFVDSFVRSRNDATQQIFPTLQNGLNQVNADNSDYMNSIFNVTSTVFDQIRTYTAPVSSAIQDPTIGLTQNADCTYLIAATDNLMNSLCVTYGNSMYTLFSVTLAFSSIGTVATLLMFLLVRKFFAKREEAINYAEGDDFQPFLG